VSGLGSLIFSCADNAEHFAGRRGAGGAKDDIAVLADDDDGPGYAPAFRFERVIRGGNGETLVDEQVERQVELVLELLVTRGVAPIDANWLGIERLKFGICLADRGQLVRSAAGQIFWIEHEQGALIAVELRQREFLAARALQREIWRRLINLDH
jgi:hypothetical protein